MTSQPPSAFMRKSLEEATSAYETQMTEEARQYLAGRGLTSGTVESFRLGYVADPLVGHEGYRGRIAIPYLTASGVTSLRFRTISGQEPKYLSMKGTVAKKIFNPMALLTTDPIFICEGEFDAMMATQCGFHSVGIAGVNNWNNNWWRVFRNFRVAVLADNDDKGQGLGLANEIDACLQDVTTILMPDGHDVTSFVVEHGADALKDLIKEKMK